MTHYPVTATWYRGIQEVNHQFPGRLRRACDWKDLRKDDASFRDPSCDDCWIYKSRIDRYRETVWKRR